MDSVDNRVDMEYLNQVGVCFLHLSDVLEVYMKRRDDIKKFVSLRGGLIAAFGLFAVGTVGCLWDSSLYDTFVNDDGNTIKCPNVSSILLKDNKTSLACVYSEDPDSGVSECTLDGFKMIKYDGTDTKEFGADSCAEDPNTDECKERKDMFDAYGDVFKYQLCPNGFQCDDTENKCVPDKTKLPFCGGKYVDPETDTNYCGAKYGGQCNSEDKDSKDYQGEKCDLAMICAGGRCVPNCETGQVFCGTSCIYPKNENKYCGAALGGACNDPDPGSKNYKGEKCGAGMVCVNGECEYNTCSDDEILCLVNGVKECKNIESDDANHCGACNYKCSEHLIPNASSSSCQNGACIYTCNAGYVNVSTSTTADGIKCIDPLTNSEHCHATGLEDVGEKCDPGKVCVQGECVQNSCTSPDTLCFDNNSNKNACINVNSDNADHCGVCNYRCADHKILNASSESCEAGDCVYVCDDGYVNVSGKTSANKIICINPLTDSRFCGIQSVEGVEGLEEADSAEALMELDGIKEYTCEPGKVCVEGVCVQNSCAEIEETPDLCVIVEKVCEESPDDCIDKMSYVCKNTRSDDPDHCGACNYKCSDHDIQNAKSNSCSGGKCQYTCDEGYVNVSKDSDSNSINCIDPQTDNIYCNAKGKVGDTDTIDVGKNCIDENKICVDGSCVYYSCSGENPNLCVVNGKNECKNVNSNDADHCGACNYMCSKNDIQNAKSETCSGGECQYTCVPGYVNVSETSAADTINCIDPLSDNIYCNAKGKDGDTGTIDVGVNCTDFDKVCVNGVCEYNSCSGEKPDLCVVNGKNDCINVKGSDANHCGTCNYKCSDHAVQNAKSSTCSGGECQYTCDEGYVNVGSGKTMQTIKCIDPKTDDFYCGADSTKKGTDCNKDKMVCVNGICEYNSCSGSTPHLCVVNGKNVCKKINGSDADHCGACNYKCSTHIPVNAALDSPACGSGNCQYKCATGYVNVGSGKTMQTIKCIDPKTDDKYCGATDSSVGTPCPSGKVCVNSTCVQNSCSGSDETLCYVNGNNTCIKNVKTTNSEHCGTCNYKCSDHPLQNATSNTCNGGACQYTCASGYVNVGSGKTMQTIKCIDPKTDDQYCGATDSSVGTPCTGGRVCVNSKCLGVCAESTPNNCFGTCYSDSALSTNHFAVDSVGNCECATSYSRNGNVCVSASNDHCMKDGTPCSAPQVCKTSANSCENCAAGKSYVNGKCETATNAHCLTNGNGCSAPQICDTSKSQCVNCSTGTSYVDGKCETATNAHCLTNGNGCSAPQICDTTKSQCVNCSAGTSYVDGKCETATNAHCLTNGDGCTSPKVCLTSNSQCVDCVSNSDCTGDKKACLTSKHQCVECVSNSDCTGDNKVCLTSNNQCVECLSNSDCKGGKTCNTTLHKCE